ncbi:hypothetical protein HanIR_Chr17g0854821 [Helianthus annuus]|nr:hypothetical protein HanIR_Chr17g0854821 [Helianthus annuus]
MAIYSLLFVSVFYIYFVLFCFVLFCFGYMTKDQIQIKLMYKTYELKVRLKKRGDIFIIISNYQNYSTNDPIE